MKQFKRISFIVCTLVGIQFFLFCNTSFAKQYHLKYWTHDSPNSRRFEKIYKVFAKRINEATQGRVVIDIIAMSPVTNPREAHDAVASGVVDMAMCITGVSPGRYPMLDSMVLPSLGYKSAEMASLGALNLVNKYPMIEKRMGNVKLIEVTATSVDMVGTAKKPIRSIEDFQGIKLRTAGKYATNLMKSMGAVPMMMGPGDIYSNLQRGVIDGYNMPWIGVSIFKLSETTQYALETNNWVGIFFSVMNLDKWNSLPPDIQQQFIKLSGAEWSQYVGRVSDENEKIARETAIKAGVEIIEPSPEFRNQMLKHSKVLWNAYITDLKKIGMPGQELIDTHLEFIKNY